MRSPPLVRTPVSGIGTWLAARSTNRAARASCRGCPLKPEKQTLQELEAALTLHPDDAPRRSQALEAHLAGATPHYEIEYRVRRPDGNFYWIHIRALCIRDAAGKPLRIAGSVADIDARKRAEMALRESEERFAAAVAGSDDGLWMFDYVTGQGFASTRAQQIVGLEPGPELLPLEAILARHDPAAPSGRPAATQPVAGTTPGRRDPGLRRRIPRTPSGRQVPLGPHPRQVRPRRRRQAASHGRIDQRRRCPQARRGGNCARARSATRSRWPALRGGHWVWDTATDCALRLGQGQRTVRPRGRRRLSARASAIPRPGRAPSRRSRAARGDRGRPAVRPRRAQQTTKSASCCPRVSAAHPHARSAFPAPDRARRIAGVSVDIGERKRAESRAPAARGTVAPGPEARGDRHACRWHRPRLQQHPVGDPGLRRTRPEERGGGHRAVAPHRSHDRRRPSGRSRWSNGSSHSRAAAWASEPRSTCNRSSARHSMRWPPAPRPACGSPANSRPAMPAYSVIRPRSTRS